MADEPAPPDLLAALLESLADAEQDARAYVDAHGHSPGEPASARPRRRCGRR